VDVLAITHMHDDHAGGAPAIIRNFRPAELWVGAAPACPAWEKIRRAATEMGTVIRHLRAGDMRRFGPASVTALAPRREYIPKDKPHNDDSLVLLVHIGRHRFLLTGDLETTGELLLAEAGAIPDVDVLKVAHHGSRTSTTDDLLDAARPRFALISAGADNTYGHPHPTVLDRLWLLGTRTFRTDAHGRLLVTSDGKHLRIETAAGVPQ
jgi:competence protein ComEC